MIVPWGLFEFRQLKTLRRDDIRRLFHDPRTKALLLRATVSKRYQFSLASLLVVMFVVGLVAQRIGPLSFEREGGARVVDEFADVLKPTRAHVGDEGYVREDQAMTRTQDGSLTGYWFGYLEPRLRRGNAKLLYVVFAKAKGELHSPVTTWQNPWRRGATLTKPGGQEVELPETDCQLYEFINGSYRESPERVSLRQFAEFLRSDPQDLSIDALLKFARGKGS